MITTEQKIMHAYNEGKAAGLAEHLASPQVTDEQIVERAVQAMYDRCYPNNTEDDWTEWARTRAECCDQAAVAMRALLSAPPAAAETEEVPMLWWFNDDNGLPYASTPYELEALQWRNSGKIVHCTKASIQEAKPVAAEFLKLRFFRDLSDAQRLAVFEVFGLLPENFDEVLTHGVQYRLFDKMIAAEVPNPQEKPVAISFDEAWKELGYNYGADELDAVRLGWEMRAKYGAPQQPAPADKDARDAARYRLLRDGGNHDYRLVKHAVSGMQIYQQLDGEQLDRLMDKAMNDHKESWMTKATLQSQQDAAIALQAGEQS